MEQELSLTVCVMPVYGVSYTLWYISAWCCYSYASLSQLPRCTAQTALGGTTKLLPPLQQYCCKAKARPASAPRKESGAGGTAACQQHPPSGDEDALCAPSVTPAPCHWHNSFIFHVRIHPVQPAPQLWPESTMREQEGNMRARISPPQPKTTR